MNRFAKIMKVTGKYSTGAFLLTLLLFLACAFNEGNALADRLIGVAGVLAMVSCFFFLISFFFCFFFQVRKDFLLPETKKGKYLGAMALEWAIVALALLALNVIFKLGRGWADAVGYSLAFVFGGKAFSYIWSRESPDIDSLAKK